jgi:hypothetical protein
MTFTWKQLLKYKLGDKNIIIIIPAKNIMQFYIVASRCFAQATV